MGFVNRAFVAAGVGFAVSAIAGCGSSGGRLLSASQSNRLSEQLNRVYDALDGQQCSLAHQYLADFQNTVDGLSGVNSTLVANLDQGASTIQSLASAKCISQTNTTPKKTHTSTSTTTTATKTQTFTNPTTTTYTQPTYTQTYTQPTNTTGGTCPTCVTTTNTNTTPTQSTTTSNGGTGLGGTGTDTSTTDTTTTSTGASG